MISHEDILRTGIALLAFVVAFYAVVARERKTPYIVNSIYTITFLVLISLLLSLASQLLEPPAQRVLVTASVSTNNIPQTVQSPTGTIRAQIASDVNATSAVILALGTLFIFYRVWRIQNRQINFRNDQLHLTLPGLLWVRKMRQRLRQKKAYEHNPARLSAALLSSLQDSPVLPKEELTQALTHNGTEQQFSTSVAVLAPTHMDADVVLADLAVRFLKADCFVQYTTASRHPIEFLLYLKRKWESQSGGRDWNDVVLATS